VGKWLRWLRRAAPGAALVVLVTLPAAAQEVDNPSSDATATAVVVLIGSPAQGSELGDVLAELLERQGVMPEIVSEERFDPGSLLTQGESDLRVWVFIVIRGEHQARLYFRGPLGKRFLLRELSLRSGLDEVGRELIAQVVETSTVALLHSTAGISRDEASATLAREKVEPTKEPERAPPPPRPVKENVRRRDAALQVVLGARAAAIWNRSAGPAAAFGGEAGAGTTFGASLIGRVRLAYEYRLSQHVAISALDASYGSMAFRGGVDGGFRSGPHRFLLGLGAGADLDRASTNAVRDRSLRLASVSSDAVAMFRAELRYELALGGLWLAASVLADFATARTHYDVSRAGSTTRVAELSLVRPGIALTLGWANPGGN
jgi:hypothetical protein